MPRMPGPPTRPRPAVGVIALGCPKNLVDTEVMLGLLRQAGFALVPDPDQAGVLLVNTCCFIEPARREAAEALAEAVRWRRAGEARALICAGCWPEMEAPALRAQFPEIDAYMGPGDVANVVSVVTRALARAGPQQPQSPPAAHLHDDHSPRLRTTAPWTAYLKIADGCSHHCRFCVIPRLRGPYRSRPLDSIIAEARQMAAEGVREINLVAQDTTGYGRDTKETDLPDLLAGLAAIDDLHWIRVLYAFPTGVTDRLIQVMASNDRVCHYLDLPFQHADRDILRVMGRPGDGGAYLKLIARLRAAMPDIALRSSFIVGFPGEGEAEFQRLLDFIQAADLDRAGAFCYSPERDTPAAELPDRPPADVAQERYHRFMLAQQAVSLARNERWIGRTLEVLLESPGEEPGEWIGRSFRDAPAVDGTVTVHSGALPLRPGVFIQAQVVGAEPYDLIAETPGGGRPSRRLTTTSRLSRGRGRRR